MIDDDELTEDDFHHASIPSSSKRRREDDFDFASHKRSRHERSPSSPPSSPSSPSLRPSPFPYRGMAYYQAWSDDLNKSWDGFEPTAKGAEILAQENAYWFERLAPGEHAWSVTFKVSRLCVLAIALLIACTDYGRSLQET
jgi:hypothetical protein